MARARPSTSPGSDNQTQSIGREEFGHTTDPRGDHRCAACQRFADHVRAPLAKCRKDQGIRCSVPIGQVGLFRCSE